MTARHSAATRASSQTTVVDGARPARRQGGLPSGESVARSTLAAPRRATYSFDPPLREPYIKRTDH
eukprot:6567727-Prymnesium_polylepis.1